MLISIFIFEYIRCNRFIRTKIYIYICLGSNYLKDSDRQLFNDASLMFIEKIKLAFPEEFLKRWLKSNAKKEFSESEFNSEYKNYCRVKLAERWVISVCTSP